MAAGASGLFAEHGLDVEIVDPIGGPDNIRSVAEGEAEFCLTSVHHYLTALERFGPLPARFVSIVVQSSPLAAIVPADSRLAATGDLAGARIGGRRQDPHTAEFLSTLTEFGVGDPVVAEMDHQAAHAALARGEVDAVTDLVDAVPRSQRLIGLSLRPIALGRHIYASGLVAGDAVPMDVVARMGAAIVAALEHQRAHPSAGLDALCEAYPQTVRAEALEGWKLLEPYVFTADGVGSMRPDRWETTITALCKARGLAVPLAEDMYRPDFAVEPAQP